MRVRRPPAGRNVRPVCLLIVVSRAHSQLPLVVAANRDEVLTRPATAMTVLGEDEPRILGGRDELAGGTWFAVNELGVVTGLTNRPPGSDTTPTKRSRGELPLALARHRSAAAAVDDFANRYRPSDYNPAWLLVGDRDSLFAVDMTGGQAPQVDTLPPGVHILENLAPGVPSAKIAHVRSLMGDVGHMPTEALVARLETVLADHRVPCSLEDSGQPDRRGPFSAACVHADGFGTRWSGIVTVPADRGFRPGFGYTDGPPCRSPFLDAGALW